MAQTATRRMDESRLLEGIRDYFRTFTDANCAAYGVDPLKVCKVGQAFVMAGVTNTPALVVAGSHTRSDGSPFLAHQTVDVYFAIEGKDPDTLESHTKAWKDLIQDAVRADWSLGGSCLKADMELDIKDYTDGQWSSMSMTLNCLVDLGGFVYA